MSNRPHREQILLQEAREALHNGQYGECERLAERVLRKNRRSVDAMQILGSSAASQGNWDRAEQYANQSVRVRPHDPILLCQMARLCRELDRHQQAIEWFDKAIAADKHYVPASRGKADLLEILGDFEAAEACLDQLESGDAETDLLRARLLVARGEQQAALGLLERHAAEKLREPRTARQLLFARASLYEKNGAYEQAWQSLEQANTLGAAPFDRVSFTQFIDELIRIFSKKNVQTASDNLTRSSGETAIFIVGLPRSGSTLIEQIIHAHPRGCGVGEFPGVDQLANSLVFRLGSAYAYPRCLGSLTASAAAQLGQEYLQDVADKTQSIKPGATHTADKLLVNYQHLGLIHMLLPAARVIHATRDPLDLCWSCYASNLDPTDHRYAADLGDLGFVHGQYSRLMEHWRQALPAPMLEVDYERLVEEPETHIRRIIDFCGLEWDPTCLDFHAARRAVRTLSYHQVRQPMYRSSIGRWRPYDAWLDPLKDQLNLAPHDQSHDQPHK